jgi:acetyltransferase-like isoleucine patch superfamily enzyme
VLGEGGVKELIDIITENQIRKQSIEAQLTFYKKYFGFQHCQLDGCGHEVRDNWVLYDDILYCKECYEFLIDEERNNAEKEINKLQKQINELKERYDL